MNYIGIDGGGTKTQFVLFDEAGTPLQDVTLPSCHILQTAQQDIIALLQQGIRELTQHGTIDSLFICAGFAGYGKDIVLRHKIEALCTVAFAPHPYLIRSDSQIALQGALHGQDGILLIAGTGSIAFAQCQEQEYRCGGWGYMLGDEGSAYAIGKQLLAGYCQECDGMRPRTTLVDALKRQFQITDDYEIIPYVADVLKNRRGEIARLAILAGTLAAEGNPHALEIFQTAAHSLADLVNTLVNKFTTPTINVCYIGGTWLAGACLMNPFQEHLHPRCVIQKPLSSPAYGAYLIAHTWQKTHPYVR